jgi:EmrB/QacA subfamily drug resistance transporter
MAPLRYATRPGRLALAAVILGSGTAFLESSVVSVALPAIGEDLGLDLGGLQWIVNGYLLSLSALIILGGSLGDRYGRKRIFVAGLLGFAATSLICGIAPSGGLLIAARVLQGVAGALLVPASLAIVEASFAAEDRARAIGAWSGFSGVSAAIGPFLGGWLVEAGSWRLVFLVVVVFALAAAALGVRALPETRDDRMTGRPDFLGAGLAALGLGAATYALVEGAGGLDATTAAIGIAGLLALVAFVVVEARVPQPMLPLHVFRSRQFTGANLATLANYFALGGAFFFLTLQLQTVLGYSALEAGAASFPSTLIMLLFSPRAGRLAQEIGPRLPMTVGPIVVGAGMVLLSGVERGSSYLTGVLPGIVVFGIGMTIFVAPLTAAVLAALDDREAGVASAVNNAAARFAQLMASAALPALAGLGAGTQVGPGAFSAGFQDAMLIAAAVSVAGGVVSFLTIRRAAPDPPHTHPSPTHGCVGAGGRDGQAAGASAGATRGRAAAPAAAGGGQIAR